MPREENSVDEMPPHSAMRIRQVLDVLEWKKEALRELAQQYRHQGLAQHIRKRFRKSDPIYAIKQDAATRRESDHVEVG